MKKYSSFLFIALVALAGCRDKEPQFTVEGRITEARDTTLYLEHLTLTEGVVAIDSARLDETGDFRLHGPRPGNPEFYRLRIGGQVVNLSIDSTETISVRATLPRMALGYQVEGSGNCDTIRRLALKLDTLGRRLHQVADDRSLTLAEREVQMQQLVRDYKTEVKLHYIQNRYERASSYYAMFQTIGGQMVFDPVSDPSDVTWFSALANSWEMLYPGTVRTENLHNIALQGHRNTRRHVIQIDMDNEKVQETGIIDMGFPDVSGRERRLSDLRGQVVLLDFTSYALSGSQERTLALRELYNRYHARGLEIYQVSLDAQQHYWKTVSEQLPWVCVWDGEGLENDIVRLYNLQALPTWFLIDRGLNLVGRMEMVNSLEEEIEQLL
ncbi:MAG: redoxin domain-containing protein [Bacteroidaceae bacterium]|nr:redoxin domain-containing protein [Bacteroidaceae bacterium]